MISAVVDPAGAAADAVGRACCVQPSMLMPVRPEERRH